MLARKQVCHRLRDGEFVVGLRKESTPTGQRLSSTMAAPEGRISFTGASDPGCSGTV